jgi:hypothetical protein
MRDDGAVTATIAADLGATADAALLRRQGQKVRHERPGKP